MIVYYLLLKYSFVEELKNLRMKFLDLEAKTKALLEENQLLLEKNQSIEVEKQSIEVEKQSLLEKNQSLLEKNQSIELESNLMAKTHILSLIFQANTARLETFETLKQYLKSLNFDEFLTGTHNKMINLYIRRKSIRKSNAIATTTIKSSARGRNNMSSFLFKYLSNASEKQIFKIAFRQLNIKNIVIQKLFDGNSQKFENFMEIVVENLIFVRAIFECHYKFNENMKTVDEVAFFQPIFQCFMRDLTNRLNLLSSSSSSSALANTQNHSSSTNPKYYTHAANRFELSFTASLFTDEANLNVTGEETITGFSDLIISNSSATTFADDDSIICLFELKPPLALAKNSNVEGPKNQACAQLKGLRSLRDAYNTATFGNMEHSDKIPKICLTDGFSLYNMFHFENKYYIWDSAHKPYAVVTNILFQLCELSSSDLKTLMETAVTFEIDEQILTGSIGDEVMSTCDTETDTDLNPTANHNNHDSSFVKTDFNQSSYPKIIDVMLQKSSATEGAPEKENIQPQYKRLKIPTVGVSSSSMTRMVPFGPKALPRRVINFKHDEEAEVYEQKIADMLQWQDELWGYGHLSEKNLERYHSADGSNLVMNKFLSSTDV